MKNAVETDLSVPSTSLDGSITALIEIGLKTLVFILSREQISRQEIIMECIVSLTHF